MITKLNPQISLKTHQKRSLGAQEEDSVLQRGFRHTKNFNVKYLHSQKFDIIEIHVVDAHY